MKKGLFRKYHITKADGRECDPRAQYFVLRLDYHGSATDTDRGHINASRAAVRLYADKIEPWLPDLAREIRAKYPLPASNEEIEDAAFHAVAADAGWALDISPQTEQALGVWWRNGLTFALRSDEALRDDLSDATDERVAAMRGSNDKGSRGSAAKTNHHE